MSKGTVSGGTNGLYSVTIERDQGGPVTVQAWCADLTEDLSGEVGVIEIAGDRDKGVNIQPGHNGNAAYNADRDGDLYLVPSFPPKEGQQAGVYWNWAMRPGWQKWRPNYRYGTITEIDYDADTCSVTLDECLSTDTPDGAAMNINQTASLSAVPIEYMSCNSAAFSVDDEVVVKFEGFEWGSPKVIGFKEAPQACWWEPWGEAICDNHDWWAYIADDLHGTLPVEQCPTLPLMSSGDGSSALISLSDGILSFGMTSTDHDGDPNSLALGGAWYDTVGSDPIPAAATGIRFKLSALAYNDTGSVWSWVEGTIILYDDTKDMVLWFAATDEYRSGLPAEFPTRRNVWIGDRVTVGEETIINFSDAEFNFLDGPIRKIQFFAYGNQGGNISVSIDYFDFIAG